MIIFNQKRKSLTFNNYFVVFVKSYTLFIPFVSVRIKNILYIKNKQSTCINFKQIYNKLKIRPSIFCYYLFKYFFNKSKRRYLNYPIRDCKAFTLNRRGSWGLPSLYMFTSMQNPLSQCMLLAKRVYYRETITAENFDIQ